MKISRPTMISVLKENTRGLTHMNRKQMWKIIEKKGWLIKLLNLRNIWNGKLVLEGFLENQLRLLTLQQMKQKYFPSLSEASKYFGKTKNYFIYNNGRVWENKKNTIINH